MKKSFFFLAAAFLLNASVAKSYQASPLLDDSASFRIAKSVKLGYGDSSRSPSKGTGTKTSDFKTCSSDNNCPPTQKCVDGNCKDVCSPNPCPEETPDCEAKDHSYTCKCTEKSCGEGKQCVGDKCEPCEEGTTCNCEGSKVIDSSGKCVCPKKLSCSAGQYVSGDCSCKNCQKDDTSGDKCGCPGNTVPDGNGSCYCKETKTCNPGYTFDDSYSCDCVVCTGSDCNCPEGTVPTPDGCKAYACAVDEDCAEGNRCENGKTENAQCVPCGKNEQCRCDEGQLSDGTGKCVSVTCKTGLVCSDTVTEQCCDAGMQCVNPDTVESYCAACEVDTQCTCPDGYLVNKEGKCVKPACTKNSDCPNGKYCENPGKSNAECVPCKEGEPCPTCPPGYVADGNGGCKLGCTFDTAPLCVSGTANCKTCTQSGGCYTCTDCKDGYYPDNGTCVSCKQKFGDDCEKCTSNKCTTCAQWYEPDPYTGKCKPKACPSGHSTTIKCENGTKEAVSSYYSGASVCKKCVNCNAGEQCACPAGQLADGKGGCKSVDPCANVTCDGGKVCSNGTCGCPSGTAWYNNKCRKVGCPSAYNDHYDMMKIGSDCKLSPNGEIMQIGPDAYTLCANCTPRSCPTATMLPNKLQNCKTSTGSGSYSGYMECVECTRCNTGYYLFMGKCLKCVNATCDGTDSATCNSGYENGHISNDATEYVCSKINVTNCSCTSATKGSVSGSTSSDHKVSISLCTKMPAESSGCPYTSIGTYIQLNSSHTSVTGVGDTRISCSASITSNTISCKHTHEPGVTFSVKTNCPSGYCLSNGKCIKKVSCNVERCSECVCGSETLCKRCNSGWTGPMMKGLSGERGYGSCDCKNSGYDPVAGKWRPGACY